MNRANFTQDLYYFPDEAINTFKGPSTTLLAAYPETKSYLLRNNDIYNDATLESNVQNMQPIAVKPGAFSPTIVFNAVKYRGMKNIWAFAETEVNFPDETKSGQLVISICDSTDKVIDWHVKNFNSDMYIFHSDWCIVDYTAYIDKIPANARKIKVFVWDNGGNALLTRKIQAKLSRIKGH